MKISRRNFCLLMAGACCTGVLAACGSSSSSTASSSVASASAAASGEVRDELIFVNYRDIRDLNPHGSNTTAPILPPIKRAAPAA